MATDGFSATINFAIRIPPICFGLQYVRRQTPPIELFFCVILLTDFFRFIFHRNFKVALVLSVVCIGVKGFFFCLFFLLLLHKGVNAAASSQTDQSQNA